MISADSRPRIASKARLRYDRKTERTMLLYPEKGLVLNPTAAEIAKLCTGEHTVAAIVERLAAQYGKDAAAILVRCDGRRVAEIAAGLVAPLADVLELLTTLAERGLVTA